MKTPFETFIQRIGLTKRKIKLQMVNLKRSFPPFSFNQSIYSNKTDTEYLIKPFEKFK